MSLKLRPAKVAALALNTSSVSEEEAHEAIATAEEETGLPADDPVRFGAGKLLDAVLLQAPTGRRRIEAGRASPAQPS
jgi:uncharacterized NAD-dependent epimerase/dehydratase family protein